VDPNATIFRVADIGVVADATTFLPVLIEKIHQQTMRKLASLISTVPAENSEDLSKKRRGKLSSDGFGSRITKLRETRGWSREKLARVMAQTPERIERVEKEEITPSVGFLLSLAKAFGIDPGTFLTEGEQSAVRNMRAQQFSRRTQNYSYDTLTPGSDSEHLRVFMVNIEPKQAHKPVAYKHEGEEFVYVMKGELELIVSRKVFHLKTGESMHFNSNTPHKLKSLSDEPTQCLVALYTP
jgi:transcriptional regulator with XRE-family HTH domain